MELVGHNFPLWSLQIVNFYPIYSELNAYPTFSELNAYLLMIWPIETVCRFPDRVYDKEKAVDKN